MSCQRARTEVQATSTALGPQPGRAAVPRGEGGSAYRPDVDVPEGRLARIVHRHGHSGDVDEAAPHAGAPVQQIGEESGGVGAGAVLSRRAQNDVNVLDTRPANKPNVIATSTREVL
jgi:hypothetical protein